MEVGGLIDLRFSRGGALGGARPRATKTQHQKVIVLRSLVLPCLLVSVVFLVFLRVQRCRHEKKQVAKNAGARLRHGSLKRGQIREKYGFQTQRVATTQREN